MKAKLFSEVCDEYWWKKTEKMELITKALRRQLYW